MERRALRTALVTMILAVFSPASWGESASLDTSLPVDPAALAGTLSNGLRYYVRANHTPEDRAQLRLAVNAGSVLESDAQRGLAHFVEHMAFNGTEGFRKMEIVSYLESIGMRFGPEVNAYTGFDETVYELEVPTDDQTIVETAFRILAEWAARVSFEPEEVEKERGVIVEEWRLGRGADGRIRDKQLPVLLAASRYADRLPIGSKEIIETAPASEIVRFYRDWYRPDLMAVIAVGDFDPQEVRGLIERTFGTIPAPAEPRVRESFRVPDFPGTRYSVATDPEAGATVVSLYAERDVRPFVTVGDYRERIVATLAGLMLSARLAELTQSADPPFVQAYSGVDGIVRTREAFSLAALVEDGGAERGLEALLVEAERVRAHGFTDSELRRAKDDLMRGMERYYRERDKSTSAQFAEEYVRAFLTAEPIPGIEYEYGLYSRELPGIAAAEVNAEAAALLRDSSRVVLAEAPEKPGVAAPSEARLEAVVEGARRAAVESYVDTVSDRPLLQSVPRGSPVAREDRLEAVGAVRWTLGNGVTVVLKPTTFKNDEVLFEAFSPGGTSLVSDEDYVAAVTATSVVTEAGFGAMSAMDLQKRLAGTAAWVSPWIAELYEGLSGSASPRELELLFQLIYLEVTSPRRDPQSFESFRSRYLASVANRGSSPGSALADKLREIMAQGSLRARPMTAEVLAEMDLDRSLATYKDRFGDAGDFTFVFVGNIDLEAVRPLVETYLGGLPSAGRRETWRDLGVDPPVGTVVAEVRKGIEPQSTVVLRFAGDFPYSRDEVVALQAAADILEIKLREQLREALSGTYGASVSVSVQKHPDQEFSVSIQLGCDPARVEEMTQAIFREIAVMRDGEIAETYLAKERETLRRGREEAVQQNAFWLSGIASALMNDEDPAELLAYHKRVDALDAEKVRRAARSYFTPARYVRVVLLPEAAP